jgi:hypothetical protein
MQKSNEPTGSLSGGIIRSNPVYPRPDERLISNATLQNGVSQLGTHIIIALASTPPGWLCFEAAKLPKTNNKAFNIM